jgi:hypothetical protein
MVKLVGDSLYPIRTIVCVKDLYTFYKSTEHYLLHSEFNRYYILSSLEEALLYCLEFDTIIRNI